jgi:hypothetical protein|tara:strand:+ start:507 stop:1505 length:999 start_codon:yes stop_codon:yes gene_type:complete
MTPETMQRLEQEAEETLKLAYETPETDKESEANQAEAEAEAELEPQQAQEAEIVEEPEAEAPELNAEDNSEPFIADGMTVENAEERIKNAQASYEHARKKMTQSSMEAADLRKQNEALASDVATLKAQFAQVVNTQQTLPDPANVQSDSTGNSDSLDTFSEDYGEDFDPIVSRIKSQSETISSLDRKLKAMESSSKKAEKKTAQAVHEKTILEAHADAFEVSNTPDFQGWVQRQPQRVQEFLQTGEASDVVWLLSSYKTAVGLTSNTKVSREQQILDDARQAADPTVSTVRSNPGAGNSQPLFTRDQIAKMSFSEYEKNAEVIDAQMMAGQL